MALKPPNTPTSIPPASSKKGVFSSSSALIPGSARRPSTSSVSSFNTTSSPAQGIGYSPGPQPSTPSSSGIPSFRTLRSLLPFGPHKNATPIAASVSPNPASKSPFASFGSVRRSMQKERERKVSLSNDATMSPIIAIGQPDNSPVPDETALRRSISLSGLDKPLPDEPSNLEPPVQNSQSSRFTLRTPSPGPALSAELSTIIEADSSGVSRHVPLLSTISDKTVETRPSSPFTQLDNNLLHAQPSLQRTASSSSHGPRSTSTSDCDADASGLDLSTTDLADQIRDAFRKSNSSQKQWRNIDKAVVIDADEHPDIAANSTFQLETNDLDPDLAELLSPNSITPSKRTYSSKLPSHSLQIPKATLPRTSASYNPSPTTPTFPPSPAPPSPASTSRLPRARQASSYLPRLRPSTGGSSNSNSPTSPGYAISSPPTTPGAASTTMTTPRASPARSKTVGSAPAIAVNGYDYVSNTSALVPSSPVLPSSLPTALSSTPVHPTTPSSRRLSALTKPGRLFSPSGKTPTSPKSISPAKNQDTPSGIMHRNTPPTPAASSSRPGTRTLRQVMLGVTRSSKNLPSPSAIDDSINTTPTPTTSNMMMSRASLDSRRPFSPQSELGLGRPSLDIPRSRQSFDSRSRPASRPATGASASYSNSNRGSTSPERVDRDHRERPSTTDGGSTSPDFGQEPNGNGRYVPRPSFESSGNGSRPSFDSVARPGSRTGSASARSQHRDWERDREKDRNRDAVTPRSTSARVRKRSMSVQEGLVGRGKLRSAAAGVVGDVADRERERGAIIRPGSSLSVHGSGNGGPGRLEWLGPRTAKAFRAAGLLDFDKDREQDRNDSSPSDTTITDKHHHHHHHRGSSIVAPSPLSTSSLNRFASTRSASEYNPRSQSRMAFSEAGGPSGSHSGAGRRGSGTFSAFGGYAASAAPGTAVGLMESPTFTTSSRDTPKSSSHSSSTAPTSLSDAFGYLGREPARSERDLITNREREHQNELAALKDKHGTEMGALLSALSDSQRTVKMLREENRELRDRLDRTVEMGRDNEGLRRMVDELREDCDALRREMYGMGTPGNLAPPLSSSSSGSRGSGWRTPSALAPSWSMGSSSSSTSGYRTPVPPGKGGSSPLVRSFTPRIAEQLIEPTPPIVVKQEEDDEQLYDATFIDHGPSFDMGDDEGEDEDLTGGKPLNELLPPSSTTPSLKKRASDTSSIFPVVPANMTMLLDDNLLSDSNRSSADHSQYRISLPHPCASSSRNRHFNGSPTHSRSQSLTYSPPPLSYQAFVAGAGHAPSNSVSNPAANMSGMSISPTTANFSMVGTGSPGSLFLKPEHEMLLGDMESLDLGTQADVDLQALAMSMGGVRDADGW